MTEIQTKELIEEMQKLRLKLPLFKVSPMNIINPVQRIHTNCGGEVKPAVFGFYSCGRCDGLVSDSLTELVKRHFV